jgi:hypothetical protein
MSEKVPTLCEALIEGKSLRGHMQEKEKSTLLDKFRLYQETDFAFPLLVA